MNGWLLDIYPDHGTNSMVCWIKTPRGVQRTEDNTFLPKIYVHSSPERMRELEQALPILDSVKAVGREINSTRLGEQTIAKTVCRHAVKAHDPLRGAELQNLVEDLRRCAMPYTCPHGRPTLLEMNYRELEKKFGRQQ